MANRNFTYAPGLPGFGTRGIDGSIGLQGLALYFSTFNGVIETIIIKNKILSNKILSPDNILLPGYPERKYRTGDLFMDIKGAIWAIDLNETNKYKSYSIGLTGEDFFQAIEQSGNGYMRWANRYNIGDNPALVDIVMGIPPTPNYADNITSIYTSSPKEFAQWKFVNTLSAGVSKSYYPFTVFGNNGDDNAMAIVREEGINNIWHIGNLDEDGNQRTISLGLDFSRIDFGGGGALGFMEPGETRIKSLEFHAEGDSFLSGELNVIGGTSLLGGLSVIGSTSITQNLTIVGNILGNNTNTGNFTVAGTLGVSGNGTFNSNLIMNSGDLLMNTGDILMNSTANIIFDGTQLYHEIKSLNPLAAGLGNIKISTSRPTTGVTSGSIILESGHGRDGTFGAGTGSGSVSIVAQKAGSSITTGYSGAGGKGGDVSIWASSGGDTLGTSSGNAIAGDGGNIQIKAGRGGNTKTIGLASDIGSGGDVVISAGDSGWNGSPAGNNLGRGYIRLETGGGSNVTHNPGDIVLDARPISTSTLLNNRGNIIFKSKNVNINDNITEFRGYAHLFIPAHKFVNQSSTPGISNSNQVGIGIKAGWYDPTDATPANKSYFINYLSNDGTTVGWTTYDGANVDYTQVSDEKLKGDIKDASISGLEILNNIPIREFRYRKIIDGKPSDILSDNISQGYIAQEILPHYPNMVSKTTDSDYYNITLNGLNIIKHKAIQELSAENTELKNRVSTLESQVAQLIAIVDPSIT